MKTSYCPRCGAPYEWDYSGFIIKMPETCEFCGADLLSSNNNATEDNSIDRGMESLLESFEELTKTCFCPRCNSSYIARVKSSYSHIISNYPNKEDLYENRCLDCNARITQTGYDNYGNPEFKATDFDSGLPLSRIRKWLKTQDILHNNETKFNSIINENAEWIDKRGKKIGIPILIITFFISFFILRGMGGASFMAIIDCVILLYLVYHFRNAYCLISNKFEDEPKKDSTNYTGPEIPKEAYLKRFITYFVIASVLPLTILIIWAIKNGYNNFHWFWCLIVCFIVFAIINIYYFPSKEKTK